LMWFNICLLSISENVSLGKFMHYFRNSQEKDGNLLIPQLSETRIKSVRGALLCPVLPFIHGHSALILQIPSFVTDFFRNFGFAEVTLSRKYSNKFGISLDFS